MHTRAENAMNLPPPHQADRCAGPTPAGGPHAPPGGTDALIARGDALARAGRTEEAIAVYRRILASRPALPSVWNNLGVCLQSRGSYASAADAFERARAMDPANAAILCNLGSALSALHSLDSAEEMLHRALALDPRLADGHNLLGTVLRLREDVEGARRAFERALLCRPDFPEAHWNLAQILLQEGDLVRGWEEYEWRWRRPDFTSPKRLFRQPRWNGEPVAGMTVLVHAEQGFGDALQFVRYVPAILRTGARVVLECQPELVRLFRGIGGVAEVVAFGKPLPGFDAHVPMMSLPRIFGTTLSTIPSEVPYLTPRPEETRRWRVRMAGEGFAVGVVWSGSQHLRALQERSCPLTLLTPLFRIDGIRTWSLQTGDAAGALVQIPQDIRPVDLSGEICDFGDSAAAVSALDLVITIDTAVAHLAGALARPAWVMLTEDPDWRWMRDREDSPWYPTMRLFRKDRRGDWRAVVERIGHELAALVRSRRRSG